MLKAITLSVVILLICGGLVSANYDPDDDAFVKLFCDPGKTDASIIGKIIDCENNYKKVLSADLNALRNKLDKISHEKCLKKAGDVSAFKKVDLTKTEYKTILIERCDEGYDKCVLDLIKNNTKFHQDVQTALKQRNQQEFKKLLLMITGSVASSTLKASNSENQLFGNSIGAAVGVLLGSLVSLSISARDVSARLFLLLMGYHNDSPFAPLNGLYWLIGGIIGPHFGEFEKIFCNPDKTDSIMVTKVIECHDKHEKSQSAELKALDKKIEKACLKQCSGKSGDMSAYKKVDLTKVDLKDMLIEECDPGYYKYKTDSAKVIMVNECEDKYRSTMTAEAKALAIKIEQVFHKNCLGKVGDMSKFTKNILDSEELDQIEDTEEKTIENRVENIEKLLQTLISEKNTTKRYVKHKANYQNRSTTHHNRSTAHQNRPFTKRFRNSNGFSPENDRRNDRHSRNTDHFLGDRNQQYIMIPNTGQRYVPTIPVHVSQPTPQLQPIQQFMQ
ncbi:unnamed protein product [Medioppia subpectinata]|uniref:Uncharacterized protein n=1 Tax=Medioppia subpectinata TaxID=1979941 RepID=A0A7R9KHU9_9ACAR|nr:unnamed protein product [Medioppia subpectinata]CAG2102595.1 unnamed protein product [Medioppia subpectinata]